MWFRHRTRGKWPTRPNNQMVLRTQMGSRKFATARHCRRDPARAYPAIRDGWPAGARSLAFRPFACCLSGLGLPCRHRAAVARELAVRVIVRPAYEECIGAKKDLVMGLLPRTGAVRIESNSFPTS